MSSSVKSLLPWRGISSLEAGTYSDITVLAQVRYAARGNVIGSGFTGSGFTLSKQPSPPL